MWRIMLQPGFICRPPLSVFINSLDKYLYVKATAGGCWEAETGSLCFLPVR